MEVQISAPWGNLKVNLEKDKNMFTGVMFYALKQLVSFQYKNKSKKLEDDIAGYRKLLESPEDHREKNCEKFLRIKRARPNAKSNLHVIEMMQKEYIGVWE